MVATKARTGDPCAQLVDRVAEAVFAEVGTAGSNYLVGTMIELPPRRSDGGGDRRRR